jgi:DNA repair exonuclease SbcCD ATPase subunit
MEGRRRDKRALENLLAEAVARARLDPLPEPEHPATHYVVEFKHTQEKLQAVREERRQAHDRVADLLRRTRQEVPGLEEEAAHLSHSRHRAQRFSQAVRLASEVLTEIAHESYEEWATALNDRTSAGLAHLNPAYRDVRFDTDLSFTLESVATGRRLGRDEVDAQLSSGAKDQIYLALRLAVSAFFSAGSVRTPIILDDVLATSDDRRFDRALRYLAEEVSVNHQVILLSCQQERHTRWRERHPDLFDARFHAVELPCLRTDPA